MNEIKIIEIPILNAPENEKLCVDLRNERYFIAYSADHTKRVSILFENLTWIRKHFGVEKNEGSPITNDSLNETRKDVIADYKLALKHKLPLWELNKVDKETNKIKINPETEKPYKPYRLSKSGQTQFQENIDNGLFVLCKYV